jgi:hypothetical protein
MTLIVRPGFQFDDDASTYIEAVEVADTQVLETATRYAINDFVIGCKQDGIWTAIKASCILSGARTLAGVLVPLAGTAPINVGGLFVSGDYNRKTGLKGDASTKYLNANRNNNVDPQNSRHLGVYATEKSATTVRALIGTNIASGRSRIFINSANDLLTNHSDATNNTSAGSYTVGTGLIAISRSSSASYDLRAAGITTAIAVASSSPGSSDLSVFANAGQNLSAPRLAFYSIGESLNLAALDARVTALITAFGVAIP